jgi:hypothetical protein
MNNYKTQDKDYIKELKQRIIETSKDPNSWKYVYNQLYLNDIKTYIKGLSSTPVIHGVGSYLPQEILILESVFENEHYDIINNANIDVQKTRVIPILKSMSVNRDLQIRMLIKEVNILKPSKIFFYNIKSKIENNFETITSVYINNIDELKAELSVAK